MLASNLCRCTGYQNIIKAVRAAAKMRDEAVTRCMRGNTMDRPVGRAARGPAAGHGPRPLRRRHLVSAPAPHARRALDHAHGRIVSIDTRGRARVARRGRGLDRAPTSPTCRRSISARAASRRSSLIASRCWRASSVRYVGEPVAAVFADDPYRRGGRRRARRRSRSRSCRRCSSAADDPASSPPAATPRWRSSARATATSTRRCARRHAVVELELAIGRHSGVPLETRGAIGRYDASRDILELHGAAKVPHRNRELLARMLELPPVVDPRARSRMSAAASASAASSIPRTCWSASPPCGSAGR